VLYTVHKPDIFHQIKQFDTYTEILYVISKLKEQFEKKNILCFFGKIKDVIQHCHQKLKLISSYNVEKEEVGCWVWTGSIWLRIGTGGRHL
jgi:hypothetical protein